MKIRHEKLKNISALANISGTLTVTAHYDGSICVWDLSPGRANPLLRSWQAHSVESYYNTAAITRLLIVKNEVNNQIVASGAYDCHIKLWNIQTGTCTADLADTGYITGLQLRRANEIVSSAVYNSERFRTVRVWNYQTKENTKLFIPDHKTLGAPGGQYWRYPGNTLVLPGPDQKIAFTTYNEGLGGRAIVVWDPNTGTHECYPVEHEKVIAGLENIPNGLVSISSDGILKKWPSALAKSNLTSPAIEGGNLRLLDPQTLICIGTSFVSAYELASGRLIAAFAVKQAFFHNTTGCDDIWIKFTDDCLFKINLPQFLTFAREHESNLHAFLFLNPNPAVQTAYKASCPRVADFLHKHMAKLGDCRTFLIKKFPKNLAHMASIDALLKPEAGATNKALKLAIEKSCFVSIEKLANMNAPITDELLELALNKSKELHDYLNFRRKMDILEKIDRGDSLSALKNLLDYVPIPMESLVELIRMEPKCIHKVEDEASGNTIVHQLVIAQNAEKLSALLDAIDEAQCQKIPDLSFSTEEKNKQDKTILDLALANNSKEVIAAVLLFTYTTSKAQRDLIVQKQIDIHGIQEKQNLHRNKQRQKQAQETYTLDRRLAITTGELVLTQQVVQELREENTHLIDEMKHHELLLEQNRMLLEKQGEQLAICMQMLKALGFDHPAFNPGSSTRQALTQEGRQRFLMFAPAQDPAEPGEALRPENSPEKTV